MELNVEKRNDIIELISNSSEFSVNELRRMSDKNLNDLYNDLKTDNMIEEDDLFDVKNNDDAKQIYQEKLITKFDGFLNEAKKPKKPKKSKGEKLKFEDWWKKSFEKISDYWIEKKEVNQGYQLGDLTHYKEKKMRAKYNKYLKRKRK